MPRRPNILLITTDEQRFDTYGATHSEWPQLTNLSRLRREGTTLTNAYANSPVCMPCRYTWVTGLYGSQSERTPNNGYDWPDYQATMPQALQRAGYHTAIVGKLHAYRCGTLRDYHLNVLERHSRVWGYDTVFECSGRDMWSYHFRDEHWGIKGCHYTDHLEARGLYEKALQENRERDASRKDLDGLEPYRPGVLAVEDTMDGFIVERMRRFIREYDREQPFFLHASFFGPHYPLDAPPEYFGRYRPQDMPPPRGITDADPGLVRRWQENRAMYAALMSLVDDQVGRLLESVEQRGLLENTVVIFTTDHGDMLGDHNFARKRLPHEGSCRTPILVRYPPRAGFSARHGRSSPRGQRQAKEDRAASPGLAWPRRVPADVVLDGLVEAADLPHTILDVAGLSAAERADALPASPGQSFWDYVCRGGAGFREAAFAEIGNEIEGFNRRMLLSQGWKYIRFPRHGDRLHDLENDPYEETNRIDDPDCAATLRDLQERLISRMAAIRQPPIQGRCRGASIVRELQGRTIG